MTDDRTPGGANGAGAEAQDEIGTGVDAAIEQLRAEVGEWRDKALRAVADAENTKRRAEREMNDARAYAIQRFARDLLGVPDNLSRALKAVPGEASDPVLKSLVQGLEMTERELLTAFERNGLKRVEPQAGDRFDPNLHQAMMEQPTSDVPPGSVIQTFQPGWELFGRIVRPAMVVTASRAAAANDAQNAYGGAGEPAGEKFDTKA
jgi:molecular chaperone GrpE